MGGPVLGPPGPSGFCHLPPPRRERRLQAERGLARVRAFFNAPVVVFHLNTLSYFSFLCLFAYVLMVDFQPTPSWCERVVYLWLFSLFCEELRQARPPPPPTPRRCPGSAPNAPARRAWCGGGLSLALPASKGRCRAKSPARPSPQVPPVVPAAWVSGTQGLVPGRLDGASRVAPGTVPFSPQGSCRSWRLAGS